MGFNIISGGIVAGVLYIVIGVQSVTYNSTTYTTGQTFRGVSGVTTYTLSGGLSSAEVDEVSEFFGSEISVKENSVDKTTYSDATMLNGFAVEFELNNNEKVVQETTVIEGFAVELIDYPFYAFEIIETRI